MAISEKPSTSAADAVTFENLERSFPALQTGTTQVVAALQAREYTVEVVQGLPAFIRQRLNEVTPILRAETANASRLVPVEARMALFDRVIALANGYSATYINVFRQILVSYPEVILPHYEDPLMHEAYSRVKYSVPRVPQNRSLSLGQAQEVPSAKLPPEDTPMSHPSKLPAPSTPGSSSEPLRFIMPVITREERERVERAMAGGALVYDAIMRLETPHRLRPIDLTGFLLTPAVPSPGLPRPIGDIPPNTAAVPYTPYVGPVAQPPRPTTPPLPTTTTSKKSSSCC